MSERMKRMKAQSVRFDKINKMPEGEDKKKANADLVSELMDDAVDLVNEPLTNPNFIFLSGNKPIEL